MFSANNQKGGVKNKRGTIKFEYQSLAMYVLKQTADTNTVRTTT